MATVNQVGVGLSGQTGTGKFVGDTSPALVTPDLGVPTAIDLTHATNFPSGSMFNFQQGQLITTTTVSSSAPTFADVTGLNVSITPTSASNKVLVRAVVGYGNPVTDTVNLRLVRGSTAIGVGTAAGSRVQAGASGYVTATTVMGCLVLEWLDSPATTSSTTYKVQACSNGGNAINFNSDNADTDLATNPRTVSVISVCEVKS